MGAPSGNQFYKFRKRSGPNIKYTAEQLQTFWNDYLDQMTNTTLHKRKELIRSGELAGKIVDIPIDTPLTKDGFCIFSGIDYKTLMTYCSEDYVNIDNDLFQIATHICDSINNYLSTGVLTGVLNSAYGARLLGYSEADTNIQPVINISLPGFNANFNKLNENNTIDIDFEVVSPIELTDVNLNE